MTEVLIPLRELCNQLPRIEKKRIHPSTLWRWCRRGYQGIYLEHVCLGQRMVTSQEALWRFLSAIAKQKMEQSRAQHQSDRRRRVRPQPPQKRRQEMEDAQAILIRAGIIKPSQLAEMET